jgi:hypothetical protein
VFFAHPVSASVQTVWTICNVGGSDASRRRAAERRGGAQIKEFGQDGLVARWTC